MHYQRIIFILSIPTISIFIYTLTATLWRQFIKIHIHIIFLNVYLDRKNLLVVLVLYVRPFSQIYFVLLIFRAFFYVSFDLTSCALWNVKKFWFFLCTWHFYNLFTKCVWNASSTQIFYKRFLKLSLICEMIIVLKIFSYKLQ